MKILIVLAQASCLVLLSPRLFTKLKTFEKNKNSDSIFYQLMISNSRLSQWSPSDIPFRGGAQVTSRLGAEPKRHPVQELPTTHSQSRQLQVK